MDVAQVHIKRKELQKIIQLALETFQRETGCTPEVEVYNREVSSIGLRKSIPEVTVKVTL